MSKTPKVKLIPRNIAALRRIGAAATAPRLVTGNPVSTRLESGVGNCFPGLECDLRNLERRFFPFLEVEIDFTVSAGVVEVSAVDIAGVEEASGSGRLTAGDAASYRTMARNLDAGARWVVTNLEGDFGPFGHQSFNPDDL